MQEVQTSLLPFHFHRQTLQVPEGLTLHEIVEHLFPRKIPGIDIVVSIGDHTVPKSQWKNIKPKMHTLVGVNAIAAGGKGGKKNPLAAIIAIALIIAAPYIVAAIAPAAAGAVAAGTATFAQTLTVAAIRIGISMVGMLATSMLSSVPKQRATPQASPTEASSQFIEGASNKVDRYGVIPVNLGTNRMFPPQAALPYTETTSNKQYVRQMFTYGFGKVVVSERRLGETLLTEYTGVEMDDRLNGDLISGVTLYTNDVYQDGYSSLISFATGYITRTTQRNVDEADVDITFTQGLTEYNSSAQRGNRTVQFEIQFAPTGTSTWSNGISNVAFGSQTVTADAPTAWNTAKSKRIGYGVLVLNLRTGVVSSISYDINSSPNIPEDSIRIASFRTENTSTVSGGGTPNIYDLVDERASHVPSKIASAGDFAFTYGGTGLTVTVAAGTITGQPWTVTDATAQALRITQHLKFPSNGQWDIRVKRITADSVDERIRDQATLTAIRSIKYGAPINQANISGTAIRMLATDQLNGTVSSYNCIVSSLIKDYDSVLDVWVDDVITSNPASIFRYVLQSPAFVKNLPDNRINIEKLEEWHTYCKVNNLTYNRIIDSPTSIDDLLNDIAAAGMATTHKINGVYSVLIDNERPTISGMVTPRNSWGYSGTINYPDLPHALRVQFRNISAGYNTDERIVYADGYDEGNATLFERLEFPSCTNADLAWFYGRRYMATALLQPEIHTFNQDFENLTYNRGDKIVFVNDVILVGVGTGRISSLIYDNPSAPTTVTGFVLDDIVNIPNTNQFGVRIRYGNASGFLYHSLNTTIGDTDTFTFKTPIAVASAPPIDSLCAFTEFGKELELIITEIQMNKDQSARVTAVNYAPERFTATTGVIPPFSTNITVPIDFLRPEPPELGGTIQSDESVMIRNSDGSYISRMVIPLINRNEPSIGVIVSVRPVGATQYFRPNVLSNTPEQVIITGLEDGILYDIQISYQRRTGLELLSLPLVLNNTRYQGASSAPADVTGFKSSIVSGVINLSWNANTDIDLSHYIIRFSRVFTGATWDNSQILESSVNETRISLPFIGGTYLIKAVDFLGNESENATLIVTYADTVLNVIETLQEDSAFSGTLDNTVVDAGLLLLADTDNVGYYYFDNDIDLGDVFESQLSASILAGGQYTNNVFDMSDIFSEADMFGSSSNDIFAETDIFSMSDVFGIGLGAWEVTLQIRTTDDDPSGSPTWTDWVDFSTGYSTFRAAQFRLKMQSFADNVTPAVSLLRVIIDMPDRIERGDDLTVGVGGTTITYSPAFKANPALNITLQDSATDDRIEFISKTSSGFTFKVYNATLAAYVSRSYDYIASGYGRVI